MNAINDFGKRFGQYFLFSVGLCAALATVEWTWQQIKRLWFDYSMRIDVMDWLRQNPLVLMLLICVAVSLVGAALSKRH